MPPLTIWSLRLALVALLCSWVLELWRVGGAWGLPPLRWAHRVTVLHLFFAGWLTQTIFAVAHWMFPTQSRQQPRGSEKLGWAWLLLLNLGVALRVLSEPLCRGSATPAWSSLLVCSGALQWAGALCFTLHIWPRIRGKKQRARDA